MTAVVQVTRVPQYEGYETLGGPNTPGEDFYLLVDGRQIGGTYWCGADYIADGQRWASWGVAGLSLRNRTREAAEQVQVTVYLADRAGCDRRLAEDEAQLAAERAARLASEEAEDRAWQEEQRRARQGDDEPGPTVWALPTHHFLFAPTADVVAVKAWLDVHGLDDVSGAHEIRVEQRERRRVIVCERAPYAPWSSRRQTWAVTCLADPPVVDCAPRPDLVALLGTHFPARFPLIDFGQDYGCVKCTRELGDPTALAPWPCTPFAAARDGAA